MDNDFSTFGYWWLPDNPENKISGFLQYKSNKSITLDLLGSFGKYPIEINNSYPIIHGVNEKNKPITLLNCVFIDRKMNMPGFPTGKIKAIILFVGVHFDSEKESNFVSVTAELSHLYEWLGLSGLNISSDPKNKCTHVDFQLPEVKRFQLSNKYSIEFGLSAEVPNNIVVRTEASIKQVEHLHSTKHRCS